MSRIDDWNYMNDPRNCDPAEEEFVLYMDITEHDGTSRDLEIQLPTHYVVCELCQGTGKHVNPAIDAGGLSEEYGNDPEFMEGYMSGVYDVTCNSCGGKRVVKAVDWDAMPESQQALYEEQLKAEREAELESYYERRMGA